MALKKSSVAAGYRLAGQSSIMWGPSIAPLPTQSRFGPCPLVSVCLRVDRIVLGRRGRGRGGPTSLTRICVADNSVVRETEVVSSRDVGVVRRPVHTTASANLVRAFRRRRATGTAYPRKYFLGNNIQSRTHGNITSRNEENDSKTINTDTAI